MEVKPLYLPGKHESAFREYRYIKLQGEVNKDNFVHKVSSAYMPLIPKSGGVLSENFIIITPNHDKFYGLSYSKDIEGWRQQIEKSVSLLELQIAKIEDERFFQIFSGQKYKLEDCSFERY